MNDYQAASDGASLFDLHERGMLQVAGRDAREFLNNLCTQDVKKLAPGQSCEAFLTTAKARVVAHVWIWQRKPDTFLLDMAPGRSEKVLQHLNQFLISEQVELGGLPFEMGLLRLIGPRAAQIVKDAGFTAVRSHPLTGLPGVDFLLPNEDEDAGFMFEKLIDGGAVKGSSETYNLLRIEAGLPEFGIDIDENRLAMEVNRPQAISYSKGCYLGQETIVMARDRGQVNRLLMGIKVSGNAALAPGTKLFRGADEIGQVTSSVFSPRLSQVIALAYLRRGSWDAGVEVVIDPATDGRTAVVCALPFFSGGDSVLP